MDENIGKILSADLHLPPHSITNGLLAIRPDRFCNVVELGRMLLSGLVAPTRSANPLAMGVRSSCEGCKEDFPGLESESESPQAILHGNNIFHIGSPSTINPEMQDYLGGLVAPCALCSAGLHFSCSGVPTS